MSQDNRAYLKTVNGLPLYAVKLVNGPAGGMKSICSHNTVYWNDANGHRYERGPDDRYYYVTEAGGLN